MILLFSFGVLFLPPSFQTILYLINLYAMFGINIAIKFLKWIEKYNFKFQVQCWVWTDTGGTSACTTPSTRRPPGALDTTLHPAHSWDSTVRTTVLILRTLRGPSLLLSWIPLTIFQYLRTNCWMGCRTGWIDSLKVQLTGNKNI